jgi:hypothetical protein
VDYYHTGNDREERFSLDRIVIEPLDWPGNPARSLDDTGRGKYFVEVLDVGSGRRLFSRGFNSVYGEWETTAEAKSIDRTFSESLRFPAIEEPARVVLAKRDAQNVFREVWSFTVDPADKFIERTETPMDVGDLIKIHEAGDPADKLDLLLVGDGYTARERNKFEQDAARMTRVLFATEPFKGRQRDINVWGLSPASLDSGISQPSAGIYRRSRLGSAYDAFGTERYILTYDNRSFRDVAAHAPYEMVEILINGAAYGGGGIFGQYGTVAVDNPWAPYVFIHEFGHHVAGLADEYYSSDVAYLPPATRIEPWEPNVTALLGGAAPKWSAAVAPGIPIPTPWPREAFDLHVKHVQDARRQLREAGGSETEMDALVREQRAVEIALLSGATYAGLVGAFEGANYAALGYFRPQIDCVMFSRNDLAFCAVCRRAIEEIIDLYSRR